MGAPNNMATSDDYYKRTVARHVDGTPVFETKEDADNKKAVADLVGRVWNCQFYSYGTLSPIDWWIEQFGRVIGHAEVKVRTHPRVGPGSYDTVFLNVRKWLSLMTAGVGTGKPACFIVKFTDGTFWIPVNDVDARRFKVGGTKRLVKAVNDREPVIEIPCDSLREVEDSPLFDPPTNRVEGACKCGQAVPPEAGFWISKTKSVQCQICRLVARKNWST